MLKELIILANKLDEIGLSEEANEIDNILGDFDRPILQTSPGKDDQSITVEWLNIPESDRGKGIGTKTYLEWEKTLPSNIKQVYLYAADLGSGSSVGFWKSLGFRLIDDSAGDTPLMVKDL